MSDFCRMAAYYNLATCADFVRIPVNHRRTVYYSLFSILALAICKPLYAAGEVEDGFTRLFNGTNLDGWSVPEGDNGHWQVVNGTIDYDAESESEGDKCLWTEKQYANFILKLDWRIKKTVGLYDVPIVLSDGTYLKDAADQNITIKMPNADSGVLLRGSPRSQVNIWCWPVGSGEVYSYRNSKQTPADVRAAVTPRLNADNPVGEWNQFVIIMVGDRLTVLLNNIMVLENAQLPDVPQRGPIGLQHHGGRREDGKLSPASSLMQFRNIWVKELEPPSN